MNDSIPKLSSFDLPAPLVSEQILHLTIHTIFAQRHYLGRNVGDRPSIVGLPQFANRLRIIWQAASKDDPFADWFLLKVSRALEESRQHLRQAHAELAGYITVEAPLVLPEAISRKPAELPLRFSTPYAYQGAYLIGGFDDFVRLALSAKHHGVIPDDETRRQINAAGRLVRRTFLSPMGYRVAGITREDVRQGTAKALQARELMGAVPDDVLSSETRPPHSPVVLSPGDMSYRCLGEGNR